MAQPQLRAEAKEGEGQTSLVSTIDFVGKFQPGLSQHVYPLLARIAQLRGNDTMRQLQQEFQRVQDAEDVHAIVRKLMKAYAPELIASFEDFVSKSYRENAQVHTQELTDRIFRRDGHDTMKQMIKRMKEAGKTYTVAVRELTAEYAPEFTEHWEDIVRKAVSTVACVRETAAVDAVPYLHTNTKNTNTYIYTHTCIHAYVHTYIHTHTQNPFPPTPSVRAVWCISTLETDVYYNEQEAHKVSTQRAAGPGYSARPSQVTLYM